MPVQNPPTLDDLPDTPDRADRATFSARSTALFDKLKNTTIAQWRAAMANVFNNATEAKTAADTAVAQSLAAIDAKNAAEQAVVAATAVAGSTQWASGSYATGAVVWSPTNGQNYRRKSPGGASPTDPANDPTNWYSLVNLQGLNLVTISTNTLAAAGRHYVMIAPCQLTLPPNPNANDRVGFTDISLSKAASVNPNGGKIRDNSEVMVLNAKYAEAVLIASGTTVGWI